MRKLVCKVIQYKWSKTIMSDLQNLIIMWKKNEKLLSISSFKL